MNTQVLSVGEEKNTVVVIDDFLDAPENLVVFASQASFAPWPMAAERKGYPGVRAAAPEHHGARMMERLDSVIRRHFSVPASHELKIHQETLNLITVPEAELGPLQRAPHFDTSAPGLYAVLLYLCDESHGGTGFYRHKSTGYETISPQRVEHYLDCCYIEFNKYRRPQKYCLDSDDLFTRVGFVPARFNRLVIYRGNTLHSANILNEKSISFDPVEGRLTANLFVSYEDTTATP
ncbi:hypothetical protein GNX18_08580 [Microbulbifer sp. SH-1]|uniref:DUF6445 family protein n=1 Tax=Microbulbifer sp. SH-1 TaxID=2681547 RepID=UPI001408D633|nr:DUF6445 family protein [Microbulbifer sp. SH-1]QIL89795.1 hypothetical protein GNX18_08580 [Microbulbifer sp. SH-1]